MSKLVKKIKLGRPPSPPDRVRANRVVTFVTDNELSELLRLAESEDLSMSAVCHHLIGESLAQRTSSLPDTKQTGSNNS